MAVSVSRVDQFVTGNKRVTVSNVTFDSSYLNGGETLTAANLGLSAVTYANCTVKTVGGSVNVAQAAYDPSTSLIHLYDETPAEVAPNADVSGIVVQVEAAGR